MSGRSAMIRRLELQRPSGEAPRRCLRISWLAVSVLPILGLSMLGLSMLAPLGGLSIAHAQRNESGDLSIELVDPKVLRVCADPRNMPFSNEKGEGFENKLAELVAHKLGKSLAYSWYPQAPGFVRN